MASATQKTEVGHCTMCTGDDWACSQCYPNNLDGTRSCPSTSADDDGGDNDDDGSDFENDSSGSPRTSSDADDWVTVGKNDSATEAKKRRQKDRRMRRHYNRAGRQLAKKAKNELFHKPMAIAVDGGCDWNVNEYAYYVQDHCKVSKQVVRGAARRLQSTDAATVERQGFRLITHKPIRDASKGFDKKIDGFEFAFVEHLTKQGDFVFVYARRTEKNEDKQS